MREHTKKDKTFLIDDGFEAALKVSKKGEFILKLDAPKDHATIGLTEDQAKEWYRDFCPGYSWKGLMKEVKEYFNRKR